MRNGQRAHVHRVPASMCRGSIRRRGAHTAPLLGAPTTARSKACGVDCEGCSCLLGFVLDIKSFGLLNLDGQEGKDVIVYFGGETHAGS